MQIECSSAKNNEQLISWGLNETPLICLDPEGHLFTSEEFSTFLSKQWQEGGSRLTLIIGGAEGLPLELKRKGELISLAPHFHPSDHQACINRAGV